MKAVVVRNYASSASRAMFMVNDFPRPMNPAPSEVIVKIHAAALNEIDISKAKGREKHLLKDTLPYIVGYEFRHAHFPTSFMPYNLIISFSSISISFNEFMIPAECTCDLNLIEIMINVEFYDHFFLSKCYTLC